jgi:hypothetical protein
MSDLSQQSLFDLIIGSLSDAQRTKVLADVNKTSRYYNKSKHVSSLMDVTEDAEGPLDESSCAST